MRTCTNCGTTITCGCQDRIASDGKRVCSQCVVMYEQQLVYEQQLISMVNVQSINQNNVEQNENTTS